MRHERAAVRMARPYGSVEMVHRLPEAVVTEMRRVENDPEPFHLAQELATLYADPATRVGALRVNARPVVRRADGAQTVLVGALEVLERDDRVGPFEAQDVADPLFQPVASAFRRKSSYVPLQRGEIANLHELAALFHRAVPRELRLRHRPGLLL